MGATLVNSTAPPRISSSQVLLCLYSSSKSMQVLHCLYSSSKNQFKCYFVSTPLPDQCRCYFVSTPPPRINAGVTLSISLLLPKRNLILPHSNCDNCLMPLTKHCFDHIFFCIRYLKTSKMCMELLFVNILKISIFYFPK